MWDVGDVCGFVRRKIVIRNPRLSACGTHRQAVIVDRCDWRVTDLSLHRRACADTARSLSRARGTVPLHCMDGSLCFELKVKCARRTREWSVNM